MRDECICEEIYIYIYIWVQEDSSKGSVGYNVAIGCGAVNGRMAACSNLFCDRNPTAPMWHGRREGEGKSEGGAMAVHVTLGVTLVMQHLLLLQDCGLLLLYKTTFSFPNSKSVILLSCVYILCSLSSC
jgi:hypothetical protein